MFEEGHINEKNINYLVVGKTNCKAGNLGHPLAPERISQVVYLHLQPDVHHMLAYLHETTDFLIRQNALGHFPPKHPRIRVSDPFIKIIILHQDGIEACGDFGGLGMNGH